MSKANVRAIIEKDDKYFMVRSASIGDFYFLPGGRIENGESLEESLKRELMEETGVDAQIGNLVIVHRIRYKGLFLPPSFIFHILNPEDFEEIDLSSTTHGEDEIDEFGFIDITRQRVLPEELIEVLPLINEEGFRGPCRIIESEAQE